MSEALSIRSGELTARIAPFGAELWSLTDRAGREYMTDADPRWWTGHAPILFPIVGALAGGRYRLGEREYALERHGFARRNAFTVVEAQEDALRFRLTESAATLAVYPFPFVLDMVFVLGGWTLSMVAEVRNPGSEPLPFSFGYHPAFAWPLPGGADKLAHEIRFDVPEPNPLRALDPADGTLVPGPAQSPVEGSVLPLRSELFERDALVWDRLANTALTYGAAGGASLRIASTNLPMLGVWQKPGANYICIEPWHGVADQSGFAGDFRDKPGVTVLAPGETASFRMDVTVRSPDGE